MTLRATIRPATRRSALVIVLLLVGLAMVGLFGTRAYRAYERFHQLAPAGNLADAADIRGWMTLPYIARAYRVPEDMLYQALALPKQGNERLSVKQIVATYGRDPQATREQIQQALLRGRASTTPAPGDGP